MRALLLFPLLGLIASVGLNAAEPGLLRWSDEWTPYIERVRPDDFKVVEHRLNQSLSDIADLVIYDFDNKNTLLYTFSVEKDADGYRLERTDFPDDSGKLRKRAIRLPRDVAARLLDVFEFILTRQVYPENQVGEMTRQKAEGEYTSIWIHLRASRTDTASGMLLHYTGRCWVGLPPADRPFFELLYRMRQCLDEPGGGGSSPLTRLDIAIGDLKLSYPRKR